MEADKDGRIAQMLSDMHACLVMSIHETIREHGEQTHVIASAERSE